MVAVSCCYLLFDPLSKRASKLFYLPFQTPGLVTILRAFTGLLANRYLMDLADKVDTSKNWRQDKKKRKKVSKEVALQILASLGLAGPMTRLQVAACLEMGYGYHPFSDTWVQLQLQECIEVVEQVGQTEIWYVKGFAKDFVPIDIQDLRQAMADVKTGDVDPGDIQDHEFRRPSLATLQRLGIKSIALAPH